MLNTGKVNYCGLRRPQLRRQIPPPPSPKGPEGEKTHVKTNPQRGRLGRTTGLKDSVQQGEAAVRWHPNVRLLKV